MVQRKPVLDDHAKRGKALVPPFVHSFGPIHEISWIKRILPEVLWIALIQYRYGHRRGVELITALSRAARHTNPDLERKLFASVSSYSELSRNEQQKLQTKMANEQILAEIELALKPLIECYPDCPLAFLVADREPPCCSSSLDKVKRTVSSLYNRSDRDPVMVQATVVWLAFDADILKVNSNVSLARFPEIEQYPETELSRQIGGGVRSTVNMIFSSHMHYSDQSPWPGYFWNRGLAIDKCEIRDER